MKLSGYEKGKDYTESHVKLELEQVAICASIDEIDRMIAFLQYAREDHILQHAVYHIPCTENRYRDWEEQNRLQSKDEDCDIVLSTDFRDNDALVQLHFDDM